MKAFRNKRRTGIIVIVLLMLTPSLAYADSPYRGYIYDNLNATPSSINGYLYQDSIDGYDLPAGPFNGPEDIFVTGDDTLYIVDGGNNRVVHIDAQKHLLGVIGDKEGKGRLNGPKGVYVTKSGEVYVADTQNRRIAEYDSAGKFIKQFGVPDSPLLGKGFVYSPSKLIVDKRGYLFVESDGANQGLLQIKPDGGFAGFFGANHVNFDWTRLFVKLVATKEQRDQLASARPPEFSNLYQDSEGFIYTTTLGIRTNQVKRLSAVGVDTLNTNTKNRYGDFYMPRKNLKETYEAFIDITVDNSGIITALDQTTGKLFQYDKLGNLLFIFGGIGVQNGLFKTPSSVVQTSDGTIYVADKTRSRIDRFSPTPFSNKVHEASKLYVDGRYEEASKPWQEILKVNSNYDLAYYAIGKSLYKQQKYGEAMEYFKIARARPAYSDAFLEYRKEYVRNHFGAILALLVLLYVIAKLFAYALRKKKFVKVFMWRNRFRKEGNTGERM